jgi:hypothetical protein
MPTHLDQGDFVLISAEDFDPAVHKPYPPAPEKPTAPAKAAAEGEKSA